MSDSSRGGPFANDEEDRVVDPDDAVIFFPATADVVAFSLMALPTCTAVVALLVALSALRCAAVFLLFFVVEDEDPVDVPLPLPDVDLDVLDDVFFFFLVVVVMGDLIDGMEIPVEDDDGGGVIDFQ